MANHKSAEKRMRQNIKRRDRNRFSKSTCRTAIKSVRAAVERGDISAAEELFKFAQKTVASAATRGVYHRKNASRKISRLAGLVNKAKAG